MATAVKATAHDGFQGASVEIGTIDIDPGSLGAGLESEASVTLTGAKVGDLVFVNPVSLDTDLFPKGARISATDTLAVLIGNEGSGTVDGASREWHYILVHLS